MDVHHVDPIVEVLAELAGLHKLGQSLVGGEDHAHVHFPRIVAAHRLELEALQDAKQFHLKGRAGQGDLVEEECACAGGLELAALVGDGAAERAFDVAEELAFEQRIRQGAAAHLDERLAGASRLGVDGSGHERFAGAAFARDQHGGVGGGDHLDLLDDALHLGVLAQEVVNLARHIQLLAQSLFSSSSSCCCSARSMASLTSASEIGFVT